MLFEPERERERDREWIVWFLWVRDQWINRRIISWKINSRRTSKRSTYFLLLKIYFSCCFFLFLCVHFYCSLITYISWQPRSPQNPRRLQLLWIKEATKKRERISIRNTEKRKLFSLLSVVIVVVVARTTYCLFIYLARFMYMNVCVALVMRSFNSVAAPVQIAYGLSVRHRAAVKSMVCSLTIRRNKRMDKRCVVATQVLKLILFVRLSDANVPSHPITSDFAVWTLSLASFRSFAMYVSTPFPTSVRSGHTEKRTNHCALFSPRAGRNSSPRTAKELHLEGISAPKGTSYSDNT